MMSINFEADVEYKLDNIFNYCYLFKNNINLLKALFVYTAQ